MPFPAVLNLLTACARCHYLYHSLTRIKRVSHGGYRMTLDRSELQPGNSWGREQHTGCGRTCKNITYTLILLLHHNYLCFPSVVTSTCSRTRSYTSYMNFSPIILFSQQQVEETFCKCWPAWG